MSIPHLQGKVQTVLGVIDPAEMGITLPHEHLVSDGAAWFVEPEEATDRAMARAKVSLETLSWIRYHWFQNLDDMLMLDEQEAVEEILHFKWAGGKTVVEMSNHGLGRDPQALARISRENGTAHPHGLRILLRRLACPKGSKPRAKKRSRPRSSATSPQGLGTRGSRPAISAKSELTGLWIFRRRSL